MILEVMMRAARDFWRGRNYGLREYVIRDGKKYPFALVCPGGVLGKTKRTRIGMVASDGKEK